MIYILGDEDKPPLTNELAHYGVKGMKWGVRRTPEQLGRAGSARKKRKADRALSKLSDKDTVVKKGTRVHNISTGGARDTKGAVFTSHTEKDILNYRANLAASRKMGGETPFENVFEAKTDIKVASERKALEAFREVYKKDPDSILRDLASSQKEMRVSSAIANKVFKMNRDDAYYKRYKKKGEEWATSKKGFDTYNRALGTRGTERSRTKYFSELSKAGYSAIVDTNDTKRYGSESPLIVFKGDKSLKRKSVIELTETDIDLALRAYHAQVYGRKKSR